MASSINVLLFQSNGMRLLSKVHATLCNTLVSDAILRGRQPLLLLQQQLLHPHHGLHCWTRRRLRWSPSSSWDASAPCHRRGRRPPATAPTSIRWLSSSSSSSSSSAVEAPPDDADDEETGTIGGGGKGRAFTDGDRGTRVQQGPTLTSPSPSSPSPSSPLPFRLYYNDVYEVVLPPRHRFPMRKYGLVRKRVQEALLEETAVAEAVTDGVRRPPPPSPPPEFLVSPLATVEELETTHDPAYVKRFLHGDLTEREQRNVGFPWSQEGVARALSSVGGTVAAACHVCREERLRRRRRRTETDAGRQGGDDDDDPAPWAGHLAGGTHHAFRDRGEGFSVFSDIAVAANVVLGRFPDVVAPADGAGGRRRPILVVDLDVHQGNGNAVLFRDDPRVYTFSVHCGGNYFSEREESDLDIELPVGCTDSLYLSTLHHWLNRLRREGSFSMIFYQAGVDVLAEDRLGRMDLSPEGVRKRDGMVYQFASDLDVPLVVTMGGGYPKRDGGGDEGGDGWEVILQAHTDVYVQAYRRHVARGGGTGGQS